MKKLDVILIVVCIALGIALWQVYNHYRDLVEVEKQNSLALGDSLHIQRSQYADLYSQYVYVQNISATKDLKITNLNGKVLTLSREVVRLQDIISSDSGSILILPEGTKQFSFNKSTDFYSYSLVVTDTTPPTHLLSMSFKPFSLTNFISRDKEGIWTGYVKIDAPFNKYLSVSELHTVVDKDEYLGIESSRFSLSLSPLGSLVIDEGDLNLGLGALVTINNKWLIGYTKVLGKNLQALHLGHQFNIIN